MTLQRHGIYSSKVSSQDSYMKEPNGNLKYASDSHEKKSHHQLKKKASSCNFSNSTPGGKSAMDKCDDLAAEISVHSSKRNYKLNSKHAVEAIRPDTVSNDHHPDGGKVISEQTEHWLHDYGNGIPNVVQNNDYMSKSSNLIPGSSKSLDTQERVLYTRMAKVFNFLISFCLLYQFSVFLLRCFIINNTNVNLYAGYV